MPDNSEALASSPLRSGDKIPTWGRFQGILLATIAILAILVLIFGVMAIKDSVVFLEETRQIERLVRAHQLVDRLQIDILKVETGQRGFLLTGEIAYLKPYIAAKSDLGRDLDRIQKSNCKDPVFRAEMPVVTALLRAKRDEIARTIRIRNTEGLSAAIPIIRSNFGITMMQLIEFHIANINRSLHRSIGQVRSRSEARKHASERHAAILITIFLLVLIGEYVYFWKSYRLTHLLTMTLEREATHDPLTGLPNRKFFYESLKLSLGRLERGIHSCIVLYLDLDRFKEVNDHFGHEAGDRLLVAFSKRLLSLTRKGDLVARIGGDEFTVILDLVEDPRIVFDFARMFEKRLTDPPPLIPEISGIVDVGVSIGWAIAPKDGMSPDALLAKADKSMYQAKEEHRRGGTESFR